MSVRAAKLRIKAAERWNMAVDPADIQMLKEHDEAKEEAERARSTGASRPEVEASKRRHPSTPPPVIDKPKR